MKRSWFVIAGAGVLVVIGSIAVLRSSGEDSRRQGALGGGEPVALSWRGDWSAEAEYTAGSVVTYDGASYVAEGEKLSTPNPGCAECGWARLATESPPAETEASEPAGGGGQNAFTVRTASVSMWTAADTTATVVPGLKLDVDLASDNVLYISIDGPMSVGAGNYGYSVAWISVYVDGSYPVQTEVYCAASQRLCTWSRGRAWNVIPGKHTIEVRVRHVEGDAFRLGGGGTSAAQLTVLVLKK